MNIIDNNEIRRNGKEGVMNMTGLTWINEWKEAILRILLDYGVIALKDQDDPDRRIQSSGHEFRLAEDNGQMLLPGIANPRWWEFGRKL